MRGLRARGKAGSGGTRGRPQHHPPRGCRCSAPPRGAGGAAAAPRTWWGRAGRGCGHGAVKRWRRRAGERGTARRRRWSARCCPTVPAGKPRPQPPSRSLSVPIPRCGARGRDAGMLWRIPQNLRPSPGPAAGPPGVAAREPLALLGRPRGTGAPGGLLRAAAAGAGRGSRGPGGAALVGSGAPPAPGFPRALPGAAPPKAPGGAGLPPKAALVLSRRRKTVPGGTPPDFCRPGVSLGTCGRLARLRSGADLNFGTLRSAGSELAFPNRAGGAPVRSIPLYFLEDCSSGLLQRVNDSCQALSCLSGWKCAGQIVAAIASRGVWGGLSVAPGSVAHRALLPAPARKRALAKRESARLQPRKAS